MAGVRWGEAGSKLLGGDHVTVLFKRDYLRLRVQVIDFGYRVATCCDPKWGVLAGSDVLPLCVGAGVSIAGWWGQAAWCDERGWPCAYY